MSNIIELRGTVTYVKLREASLFMTVREASNNPNYKGAVHTIKMFAPKQNDFAPGQWASQWSHIESGMTVILKGQYSKERVMQKDPESGQQVAVRHPTEDCDLYQNYIWGFHVDAIFDPALHVKRGQQQASEHKPGSTSPQTPSGAATKQAPTTYDLPPIEGGDEPIPWN